MNIDLQIDLKWKFRKIFEKCNLLSGHQKVIKRKDTTIKSKYDDLCRNSDFIEAKTIAEAIDWGKKNLGIANIDYRDFDIKLANAFNKTLKSLLIVFPEVKEYINYISSVNCVEEKMIKNDYWLENMAEYINIMNEYKYCHIASGFKVYRNVSNMDPEQKADVIKRVICKENSIMCYLDRNIVTGFNNEYNGIFLGNELLDKYNNYEDWLKDIKKSAKKGIIVNHKKQIEGIIMHEFTHAIYEYLKQDDNFNEELKSLYYEFRAPYIKKNLSKYGATRIEEFFAEALSEYLSSSKPRKIAKLVGGLVEKYIKKHRNNLM